MEIRPRFKKELRRAYKISKPTLNNWLRRIPDLKVKPTDKVILPDDLAKIFAVFGNPFR